MKKLKRFFLMVMVLLSLNGCGSSGGGGGGSSSSWTIEGSRISGTYCDADVVGLPSGGWRIYFSLEPEAAEFNGQVYSAASTDGLVWTIEDGTRMTGVVFPNVIFLDDGRWRMYFQESVSGNIRSAVSSDGLVFTPEAGDRIAHGGTYDLDRVGAPSVIRLGENNYRMYYLGRVTNASAGRSTDSTRILSAHSSDGLVWTKDDGIRIDGTATPYSLGVDGPDAVVLDSGLIRLFFFARGQNNSHDGIYQIDSADGLDFSSLSSTPIISAADTLTSLGITTPGDPTAIKLADGRYRIYFGIFQHGIYSAVK